MAVGLVRYREMVIVWGVALVISVVVVVCIALARWSAVAPLRETGNRLELDLNE